MKNPHENLLSAEQKSQLRNFILAFIPQTGEKRKYNGNLFITILQSLDKVFYKKAGYHLTDQALVEAFLELDYGKLHVNHPEEFPTFQQDKWNNKNCNLKSKTLSLNVTN